MSAQQNAPTTTRRLAEPWPTVTAVDGPAAAWLIRVAAGTIFLSEGIQKFLYPDALGTGRFDTAGLPAPGFLAGLDGVFEIACGALLIAGLFTRLAAIPMIVNMIGALAITKIPILWGGAGLFTDEQGWWDFTHEARTDWALLLSLLFLLAVGSGPWSLDARLTSQPNTADTTHHGKD